MQHQVLPHGQFAIKRESLRHIAHALARSDIVGIDLVAKQPRLSLGGGQQAAQHFHRGGLAAAIGAKEAEDLAPAYAKRHMIHRGEIAKAHGQPLRFDGDIAVVGLQRRDNHRFITLRFIGRQQTDKRFVQVGAAGARQQFRGGACRQHLAIVHRHQPIKALGFVHIGCGHEHAHARTAMADTADQRPELGARQRIDAGGRLVEQQKIRVMDQRATQAQLLLHAARQLAGRALEKRRQAGTARQVVDAAAPLGLAMAEQAREELQVFLDGERGIKVLAQALRHVGDAGANGVTVGLARHVAAQHLDASRLDGAGTGQQRHQRGLADAIRADHTHHAASGNVQRHILDGHGLAIVQRQRAYARDHHAALLHAVAARAGCAA